MVFGFVLELQPSHAHVQMKLHLLYLFAFTKKITIVGTRKIVGRSNERTVK